LFYVSPWPAFLINLFSFDLIWFYSYFILWTTLARFFTYIFFCYNSF
jgi:hypothetical protein